MWGDPQNFLLFSTDSSLKTVSQVLNVQWWTEKNTRESRQLLFQLSPHIFWDCTSHCTILLRNHYATQAVLKLMWLFLFLVFITLGYQASIVWSHLGNLLLWFLIYEILILYGFEEKRAGKRPQGLLWHWGDSLAIKRTVCSSRGPRFSFQQQHDGSQWSLTGSEALFKHTGVHADRRSYT